MMGLSEEEKKLDSDANQKEIPHEVTITKPFFMGKYEVTQAQFTAVMSGNPSEFKTSPENPVEMVSFDQTQQCIEILNRLGLEPSGCLQKPNGNMPAGQEQRHGSRLARFRVVLRKNLMKQQTVICDGAGIWKLE